MENVSDHETIGPRRFWGSQKIFHVHLYKIFQKQILIKMDLYMDFLTIFTLHCTTIIVNWKQKVSGRNFAGTI